MKKLIILIIAFMLFCVPLHGSEPTQEELREQALQKIEEIRYMLQLLKEAEEQKERTVVMLNSMQEATKTHTIEIIRGTEREIVEVVDGTDTNETQETEA